MLTSTRRTLIRAAAVPLLALTLLSVPPVPVVHAERDAYDDAGYASRRDRYDDRRHDHYNSEYIFAATRGVNEMDAPPFVKITLIPLTIILDVAFLPFAAVAGLFG